MNILSNFFNAIGDGLAIIASQEEAMRNLIEEAAKVNEKISDSNNHEN